MASEPTVFELRCARAIYERMDGTRVDWDRRCLEFQNAYIEGVRAAIDELRVPDAAMVKAMNETVAATVPNVGNALACIKASFDIWPAMLNAASPPVT